MREEGGGQEGGGGGGGGKGGREEKGGWDERGGGRIGGSGFERRRGNGGRNADVFRDCFARACAELCDFVFLYFLFVVVFWRLFRGCCARAA